MKIKSLVTALFFLTCSFLNAQSVDTRRFIEMKGTSETEVTPDIIYLSITLLERMEGKEKLAIEKQEGDLKKALKDLGIDLANLTLNSADADYSTIRRKTKETLVSKSYGLKITSTEMLTKVYLKLDEMNAHDAYVSRYSHSKLQEIQKENRIKAMKTAKEKAEYLLAAIGELPGQALLVEEIENYVEDKPMGPNPNYRAKAASYSNDRFLDTEESSIAFKSIKIRSSYLIKFEILTK